MAYALRPRQWLVGRSLMLELGYSIVLNCQLEGVPPGDCETWRQRWHEFAAGAWNPGTLLAYLGVLTGALHETDYILATGPARQLTLATAAKRMQDLGAQVGILPAETPSDERAAFVDLCVRARISAHESEGLEWNPDLHFAERIGGQYALLARIMADGDLAGPFWNLLDQYYVDFYQPWQSSRLDGMTWLEASTRTNMGGSSGSLTSPEDVAWLPPQHVLHKILALADPEKQTHATIFFWVDPFQLQSAVSIHPGVIAVSCSFNQGAEEENRERTELLALRMKALGDPTRLAALSMIRHFGMDNTETAKLLGVSRPTVSNHLKILQDAGLVETTIVGRSARHHVNTGVLRETVSQLLKHLDICEAEDESSDHR